MPRKLTRGRSTRSIEIAVAVGWALKEARTTAKLSQREIAERTGMSRQLYVDIEHGKVSPRVDQVDAIARACGISPTVLVRRTLDFMASPPTPPMPALTQ